MPRVELTHPCGCVYRWECEGWEPVVLCAYHIRAIREATGLRVVR